MAIKFSFRIIFAVLATSILWPATSFSNEQPVALIEKALASFGGIKDYTCLYIKEEKAIDNMEPQTIRLYVREPAAYRLEWLNGKNQIDQIVVYREGFYKNQLRVKESGILGLAGVMSIDPNGKVAQGDSKHRIYELGLDKVLKRVISEISKGQMTVNDLGMENVNGRDAHKLEILSTAPPGFHFAKRTLLWLDAQSNLPVKHEHYDAKDQLFERHVYKDIKINVGLGDDKFTM